MPRRARRARRAVAAGGAVLLAWAVWAYAVIQTPALDPAGRVDAVLVLGGLDTPQRTERALDLVRDGLTRVVVLSVPNTSNDPLARRTCEHPPADVTVLCFTPQPSTTRGEARELGRLAAERGWTRVAVVTSTYHVSRARSIVGRCFGGTVLMLRSDDPISPANWAYQYIYQTAGYVKAEILRGC